jgi:hypothetical protein
MGTWNLGFLRRFYTYDNGLQCYNALGIGEWGYLQHLDEVRRGELAVLIDVEDLPWRISASSSASMQKSGDSVIDSRPARTLRLNQSTTAAR